MMTLTVSVLLKDIDYTDVNITQGKMLIKKIMSNSIDFSKDEK